MKTNRVSGSAALPHSSRRIRRMPVSQPSLRIKNVLVPTDFSARSLQALLHALPLTKSFGAKLHLVHVSELDYPLSNMAGVPIVLPERETRSLVRRDLQRIARKHSICLGEENIHTLKGSPFEEICRFAREKAIDLIVMSTHGNTGFKHFAMGSTAERVVRYSPCPVLVMHTADRQINGNGKTETHQLSFKRIIVPIDFSGCSLKGLDYAKALAKRFGSELILLNSVALHYYFPGDEYARYDVPKLVMRSEHFAREQMGQLIRKTDWKGIKVTPSFQIGHAGDQICTEAVDQDADVIVTSTHGITGFKHMLVGSTAEYVVRHALCPVLVVPSHERPASTEAR
jgi:nucleotide-binding universal stress UspA family protein